MMPIVNGLEAEFEPDLIVRRLNAGDPEVAALQGRLNTRGHPAFVILDNRGEPVYRAFGSPSAASLRAQIRIVLKP